MNERKNIGEILLPIHCHVGEDPEAYIPFDKAATAMQDYADQEMARFAIWLNKNHYIHALHKPGHWLINMPNSNPPDKPLPTTQQLITKYKEDNL